MNCKSVPTSKAIETARRTRQTGKEHAFVICGDGSVSEIQEGDDTSIVVEIDCKDGPIGIFHTHPNDNLNLSPPDRDVLNSEDVGMVCVGDTEGNYLCHGERAACHVREEWIKNGSKSK